MAKYCMTCGKELSQGETVCSRCGQACPDQGEKIPPLYRITDSIISGKTQESAVTTTGGAGVDIGKTSETIKKKWTEITTTGSDTFKQGEINNLRIWIAAFAVITIIGMFLPFASNGYATMAMFHCAYSSQLALDSYIILVLALATGALAILHKRLPAMIGSIIVAITLFFDMNQEALRVFFGLEDVSRSVGYFVMMIGAIGLLICGIMNYLHKNKQ